MSRIVLFFLLGLVTTFAPFANAEKLRIVSTIKPVHLLAQGVAGAHAETALLIPETMSAHDYSFRPSDLKKLDKADVVVRVADNLEVFLNPLLQGKQVISLGDAKDVIWLPIRHAHDHGNKPENKENSDSKEHEHHHDEHDHDAADDHQAKDNAHHHDEVESQDGHKQHGLSDDPHIWLNPNNVKHMVTYLASELGKLDPKRAKDYAQNAQQLLKKLQIVDQDATSLFQNLKDIPYLVFHDGWHYLEHAYGLHEPEVISYHEGLSPGAKTLRHLRKEIQEKDIHCLITSPNNNQAIMKSLIGGTKVHISYLSPIGTGVKASNYAEFMKHNVEQIAQCLQRSQDVR